MTEYERLLDKMYFEIGSTLIDNDCCRKGIMMSKPVPEEEILKSNRRTFMNLKVMMMRLERSLFGAQNVERPTPEISTRNTSKSDDTKICKSA
jgi:hypothetical protein